MIIIVDDTFEELSKFYNIEWINDEIYKKNCSLISTITSKKLRLLVNKIKDTDVLCYHESLKILDDNNNNPLNQVDNLNSRSSFINEVSSLNTPTVVFSGALETNYELKRIDKRFFYFNLKGFIDYYIESGKVELRVLFFGANFEIQEKFTAIRKMFLEIRKNDIDDFEDNDIITRGISLLNPKKSPKEILEDWRSLNLSKNQIIQEINNQIH